MSNDILDLLTQETFNMTPSMSDQTPFEQHNHIETENIPDTPGIFYILKKSSNTFTIKIAPCSNLNKSFKSDQIQDLADSESHVRLQYHTTEYYELACAISEQIGGRRFPINEEFLYNFSDPGQNWWMTFTSKSFRLHFKSHRLNHSIHNLQLGPIGDGQVACKRFRDFLPLAKSIFSPVSFTSDNKSFGLQLSEENSSFTHFINLFNTGIIDSSLEELLNNKLDKTLFYYFKELSAIRIFWKKIQNELGNLSISNYSH